MLTKPDLVDRGAEGDVLAVVNNQRVVLKKGYTIVKCRGQQAIKDGKTLEEAMDEEMDFFKDHEHFGWVFCITIIHFLNIPLFVALIVHL